MSEPTSVAVDLSAMLDSLERLYMIQRSRGFARPKPKLLNPDDRAAADIPSGFLEWWKGHDNCDINPVVAWKTALFRNQFYRNPNGYAQLLSD
jgi:hypothetical protein